jgi:hypothetical protein
MSATLKAATEVADALLAMCEPSRHKTNARDVCIMGRDATLLVYFGATGKLMRRIEIGTRASTGRALAFVDCSITGDRDALIWGVVRELGGAS